jgi:hypothetical protein
MLFDKEVNIEFTSDFYYILDWCQRLSKDPYYFFIKIFRHHKYVFFFNEKFNNSSYSSDQLNKLVL